MSSYFDLDIDRRQTSSIKWGAPHRSLSATQAAADPFPMWIADMDFRTPPPVIEALAKAVQDGIFGYPFRTGSYEEAVCGWQQRRFGWKTEPSWLVQTPGIVTALNLIIQTFSKPGDAILVQPPVYGHFIDDVRVNGRRVVEAPLVLGESSYAFDPEAFEAAITPDTKMFILCNPHNPTGNVWSEAELRIMGEICLKRGILVISDEIHQDLVFNPRSKHKPYASVDAELAQNAIICTAPSKTFNIAGLQCSNLFIPNPAIREELQRTILRSGINFVNSLGAVACEAAYRHGESWLEELLLYIRGNHEFFAASVRELFPMLRVFDTDALYLAWVDCRRLGMPAPELENFMLTNARIWFDRGSKFGVQGQGFLRANLGCPRANIVEAIKRMKGALM